MFKPAIHWVSGLGQYRLALMPYPHSEWLRDEVSA